MRHSALAGVSRLPVGVERRGRELLGALLGEWCDHDVGGGVEVILRMAAYELAVPRERDVALDDAGTLPRSTLVRLLGVLGELQRRAAVPDREVGAMERPVLALHQPVLQRAFIHALNQVERPRVQVRLNRRPCGRFDGHDCRRLH